MNPSNQDLKIIIQQYGKTLNSLRQKATREFDQNEKYHNYNNSDEVVRFINYSFNMRPHLFPDMDPITRINRLFVKLESQYPKNKQDYVSFYEDILTVLKTISDARLPAVEARPPRRSPRRRISRSRRSRRLPQVSRPGSRTQERRRNDTTLPPGAWQPPRRSGAGKKKKGKSRRKPRRKMRKRTRKNRSKVNTDANKKRTFKTYGIIPYYKTELDDSNFEKTKKELTNLNEGYKKIKVTNNGL